MQIKSITIENYRSIEKETFEIKDIDGGYSYTLIGVNESGKSSFLKAISLKDGLESVLPHDFHDISKPIVITFNYILTDEEKNLIKEKLTESKLPEGLFKKFIIKSVFLKVVVDYANPTGNKKIVEFILDNNIIKGYAVVDNVVTKNEAEPNQEFDIKNYLQETLLNFIIELSHKVIFWKSEARFLITDPINLEEFVNDPEGKSIPLRNCFDLAGFNNIQETIAKIRNNPAEVNNLQEKLSDEITAHIKRAWPGHPVKIKFQIDNMHLSFLIEDEGVKYKTKTTAQRSDGFRQFVSFLLTVSAQSSTGKLSNSLLLLDEPETHIHPQGQENLRDELIKITKGNSNNICIFATHSNYMIDKTHLDRCYRLVKEGNNKTKLTPIDGTNSSYSEVNYIVFDVPTNDYHNELYGFLEAEKKSKLNALPKDKIWKNEKTGKDENVSLATYIRHSIHHPENDKNKPFTNGELIKSIGMLSKLKYGK